MARVMTIMVESMYLYVPSNFIAIKDHKKNYFASLDNSISTILTGSIMGAILPIASYMGSFVPMMNAILTERFKSQFMVFYLMLTSFIKFQAINIKYVESSIFKQFSSTRKCKK